MIYYTVHKIYQFLGCNSNSFVCIFSLNFPGRHGLKISKFKFKIIFNFMKNFRTITQMSRLWRMKLKGIRSENLFLVEVVLIIKFIFLLIKWEKTMLRFETLLDKRFIRRHSWTISTSGKITKQLSGFWIQSITSYHRGVVSTRHVNFP